jgi:hypothetical protein
MKLKGELGGKVDLSMAERTYSKMTTMAIDTITKRGDSRLKGKVSMEITGLKYN